MPSSSPARPSPRRAAPTSAPGSIASGRASATACGSTTPSYAHLEERAECRRPRTAARPAALEPDADPDEPTDFLHGIRTMTTAGDVYDPDRHGGACLCRQSLDGRRSFLRCRRRAADRAAAGRPAIFTEMGMIELEPGEICVIPRGMMFKVELDRRPTARGYICENYGAKFTLPDRGPIGANCLANPRDFKTPVAGFEDKETPCRLHRQMVRPVLPDRDRPFAARRRRLARQLRALQIRPRDLLAGRRDPVRPSRPVDLHGADRAIGRSGHRQCRFRHLPAALAGGRAHLPPALVPPQHHERVHGPDPRPATTPRRRASCRAASACTT